MFFFGSGRGLNPGLCIFYALSQPTELSSRGQKKRHVFNKIKNIEIFIIVFNFEICKKIIEIKNELLNIQKYV